MFRRDGVVRTVLARRLSHAVDGEGSDGKARRCFNNRNPRALELMGAEEKPRGFATARHRPDFYHRLTFCASCRHISAQVQHNSGRAVVSASTKELCLSRHLYKTSDLSASYNVGRVLAARCHQSGLGRVMWERGVDRHHGKVKAFVKGVSAGGLLLHEQ